MDNVTHALAGLLLAEAAVALAERTSTRALAPTFRRAALITGVVAAELPDADLLYAGEALGMGPLGYMLHHRGHTHTVVFAILGALLIWGATLAFRRELRAKPESRWLLGIALAGTLFTHLALDWTNSYGVHPWWPLSNAWQYGDAVFIIEPWLWVAMVPPLLFLERSRIVRALLGAALAGLLALAWSVAQVGRDVAIALTVGVPLALLVARTLGTRHRRIVAALLAFVAVEATYFAASSTARAALRAQVGGTMEDAVLTPAVGDPTCVNALVVERDGPTYRLTGATIATAPTLRPVAGCAPPTMLGGAGARASVRQSSRAIRWGNEWSAPVAELQALAKDNCELAAALRFIRAPVWERLPDGRTRLADQRYRRGGRGFAEIASSPRPARCPRFVPPWTPPRARLLVAGLALGESSTEVTEDTEKRLM